MFRNRKETNMSVGIWNADEQKLEKIAGKVNLNDSSTSEEHTWSSKKISDSLADLESALDDKADKSYVDDNFATMENLEDYAPKSMLSTQVIQRGILNSLYTRKLQFVPKYSIMRIYGFFYGGICFEAYVTYNLWGGNCNVNYLKDSILQALTIKSVSGEGVTIENSGENNILVIVEGIPIS